MKRLTVHRRQSRKAEMFALVFDGTDILLTIALPSRIDHHADDEDHVIGVPCVDMPMLDRHGLETTACSCHAADPAVFVQQRI